MIYYLIIPFVSYCLINETFVYYSAVMHWQEMRDSGKLNFKDDPVLVSICYWNLFKGLLLDTLLNWIVLTPVLCELPREFLTTARLCRWYNTIPTSRLDRWRLGVACWTKIRLDKVDPSGVHIK